MQPGDGRQFTDALELLVALGDNAVGLGPNANLLAEGAPTTVTTEALGMKCGCPLASYTPSKLRAAREQADS